jgi:membrane peptidoglycan carboxypeptidase
LADRCTYSASRCGRGARGTAQSLKNWVPAEAGAAAQDRHDNEQRDAWLAGSPATSSAVWVGYDDNRAARLPVRRRDAAGEMMRRSRPAASCRRRGQRRNGVDRPASGCAAGRLPGSVGAAKARARGPRAPCSGTADAVVEAVGDAVKPVKG